MISGEDDRPTVDLGPRPATEEPPASSDLGDDTQAVSPDPVHGLPTQALSPRKKSATDSHHTRITTTTSPVEAMKLEEIARSQVFLRVAILTCFAGVIVALATGGDPIAFRVVMGGCILTTAGALWMLASIRDPATYTPRRLLGPALVIAFGAFGGVYYWGPASPVSAMIAYGIYFFALGSGARLVTAMYVLESVMHGGLIIAIMLGIVDDRGIVNMQHLRRIDQIGILSVVEFLYFITFYTARVSQRVTLDHVTKLEQAVRGVAQREALLAEARAELDRAIAVGGPGRFTDQQVGNFRLGVLIGRGGMGEVYEAASVSDRGEAAVKLLHPGTLADPTHVARFVREAQTAAKLDCPNVVRVLEVGTTAGEVPFLAMERLRGHDLAHQLRRQRRISLAQAVTLVDHVAVGLEAARASGIVHRDLKPHNVFLAEQGGAHRWKILDFGVSKQGGSGTLTQGHVVGTPAYMAPEQAKGEDVDHRADVYSLAAILYRAVTGHPAFTGKDVPTTLYEVVYRVPTQPSMLAPVPGDVDRVLMIGLAKSPRDRFQTATELAEWFAAAVSDALTSEQRQRADDLASRQPWGTRTT
ncbi:MAG: serine/threonine protein kinase [Deltaproteobacteria bacterium]|nr:serine/threonine protein kinase [Deltaproteobacteria bacterium]